MKRFLNKFIDFLPSKQNKAQNLLFTLCVFSIVLFCFGVPAFSNIHPFNLLLKVVALGMCVVQLFYVYKYGKFKFDFFTLLLILFNIIIIASHVVNLTISSIPDTIILMSVMAFCIYEFQQTTVHKNLILYCIFAASLLFAIVYIIYFRKEFLDITHIFSKRLGQPFDNSNELGKEFGVFSIVSFALFFKQSKTVNKVLCILSAALFAILLLTTGSISNLLVLLIVSITMLVVNQKTKKAKYLALCGVIVGLAMILLLSQLPGFSYFKNRIDDIINTLFNKGEGGFDNSTNSRFMAFLISIKVGLNRIIFGYGYMSATNFTFENIQSHNNIAELFVDFGLTGLVVFELLLITPIYCSRKDKDKLNQMWPLVYVLIFQLFLTLYYKKLEYVLLAYCFSSCSYLPSIRHQKTNIENGGKEIVVEIIPSLSPIGGAESFVTDFSILYQQKYSSNKKVVVIVYYKQDDSNFLLKKLKDNGVEVVQLNKKPGLDFFASLRLRKIIKKLKPSIVHTHLDPSLAMIKLAFPFKKMSPKIVYTIHQNFPTNETKSSRLALKLIKTHYLYPICVAKIPSEQYSNNLGFDINYINNGVMLSNFDNTKPLSDREIDYLVVGRFVEIKNHMFLLKIINDHFKERKKSFVFIGDGPLKDDYLKYVEENSLGKIVKFTGTISNVNEYMSNAKVLLMPSLNEGNPMVINEALASGMLVVGNKVGGIEDLLSKQTNCKLVEVNDSKGFVDAMESIIRIANSAKTKSLDFDFNSISLDRTVEKYNQQFDKLLTKKEKEQNEQTAC